MKDDPLKGFRVVKGRPGLLYDPVRKQFLKFVDTTGDKQPVFGATFKQRTFGATFKRKFKLGKGEG